GLSLAVLLAVGRPITHRYAADRYRTDLSSYASGNLGKALASTFTWAQGIHHTRIGLEGGELPYPLYGSDLSNYVQYVGRTKPDGGFARIGTCQAWRRSISAGRFTYVMTVPWG